ncbi:hypothetical protein AYI68_g4956 [Smittium mucronatum]|uniref:Uncharacterized protein n=1 Tax=Smittium mucronatum TaxID=133383 RepID=A0A1R0GVL9_9FUNG|nr:hypothetical protein AYI68_g4956 [Smittium mucronatum]
MSDELDKLVQQWASDENSIESEFLAIKLKKSKLESELKSKDLITDALKELKKIHSSINESDVSIRNKEFTSASKSLKLAVINLIMLLQFYN